jgi:putative transposase
VWQGVFNPEPLDKGLRSERALTITMAEMFIQGVSTRKVTAILERVCDTSVSSTHVSKAIALLDETMEAWCCRPLSECPYLFLDARYEKMHQDDQVRDAAVLMTCGVDLKGKRQLLGVSA